jgi:hypothetical protein
MVAAIVMFLGRVWVVETCNPDLVALLPNVGFFRISRAAGRRFGAE